MLFLSFFHFFFCIHPSPFRYCFVPALIFTFISISHFPFLVCLLLCLVIHHHLADAHPCGLVRHFSHLQFIYSLPPMFSVHKGRSSPPCFPRPSTPSTLLALP